MEGLPGDSLGYGVRRSRDVGLSTFPGALDLPEWRAEPDDASRVIRAIDAWAGSDPLAALVAASGGYVLGEGVRRLDELADFSTRWDARGGQERDRAERRALHGNLERLTLESARELGQADRTVPRFEEYDAVIMTGGMVRAEIVKPRFVRELMTAGVISREIVFLGGFRSFSAEERLLAGQLAMSSSDEFSAMAEGLDRAFGPLARPKVSGDGEEDPHGWRELSWRHGDKRLSVLAAPSSDPTRRRAHTADTFRFWAERRDPAIRRVLVVTTPVYVPYQATVAVELLGGDHGIAVDTIGVTASASDLGAFTQPFLAQHHLQELRSAILAMRSLRSRLTGPPCAG